MKLIVVAGARPNFIKVAPLMPVLWERGHEAELVHTGQHYGETMSGIFFSDLEMPEPRWFLNVGSGKHAVQTGKAMIALESLFEVEHPEAIIVVGDVNSTLAGALAASKMHIPVIHLEAGLRSFDMLMPEEVNRLVADQLASLLLTPTVEAGRNLENEGVEKERIRFVGNIMAESVLKNLPRVADRKPAQAYGLEPDGYVLSTIHRPENTDHPERLGEVLAALRQMPLPVLFPAHPRTHPKLSEFLEGDTCVRLIEPVGYLDMLAMQRDAALILTDSGGLQEESCLVGTPCVTVRRNTERGITIELGSNRLVSANEGAILAGVSQGLAAPRNWQVPERWDDQVSSRIADVLDEGLPTVRGA